MTDTVPTTTRLDLTADQWSLIIGNLYRITDEARALALTMHVPDIARWATEIREILLDEAETPFQQMVERAESQADGAGL